MFKNYRRFFICFIFSMLISTNKVFAVWYSGGSSSDVQSSLTGGGDNNTSTSSPTTNTQNNNQNNNQNNQSHPTGPTGPSYPDPNDNMSDKELKEIAEKGDYQQRKKAEKILEEREYRRVNNQVDGVGNELGTQVGRIENTVSQIPEPPEETVLPDGMDEEVEEEQTELQEKIEETEIVRTENVKTNDAVLQTKNAQKGGDPVKISEGSYEQEDVDFQFNGLIDFEIKRRYSSAGDIISSFGYGWYFNLDERIILGTAVHPEETKRNLTDYSEQIKNLIEEYKEKLETGYKVSDIYKAEEIYNKKITDTKAQASEIKKIINTANQYISGYSRYDAINKIKNVKQKAENILLHLDRKIKLLEASVEDIKKHVQRLNDYETEYQDSLEKITAYDENFYKPSMERKRKNQYAMLNGMALWYEETGLDTLTLIDENGYPYLFREDEIETGVLYSCDKYQGGKIQIKNNEYEFIQKDGFVKLFDEKGYIKKIIDRNENYILINRKENEKIDTVETSNFEKLKFEYDKSGKYIVHITNSRASDENTKYAYNGNKLISVKDSDGDVVNMDYDEHNRMVALKKCDGSKVIFEYGEMDSDGNLITTATINEEGFAEHFIYDKVNRQTDYIDHDNNRYSYWYDEKHRTVKELQPDGTLILMEYDDNDLLIKKEINGSVTRYYYDENGNVTLVDYKNNSQEKWSYNKNGQIISHIDPDNITEEFIRDEKGNLLEYKKGGQTVYRQTVNTQGQVKQLTVYGQQPVITDYEYDEFGNLSAAITSGIKTEYTYDSQNRLCKIIKAGKEQSEYSYGKGTVKQKFYNGLETEYISNGRKDITTVIQKDIVTGVIHQRRIVYDKRHLPLFIYAGDGSSEELISSYLYTAEGKISAKIKYGEECWIRLFEYGNGRIREVKQFMLNNLQEVLKANSSRTSLEELSLLVGENIYIQKYDYSINELNGIELKSTASDGMEYFPDGSLKSSVDNYGNITRYNYDNKGKLISAISDSKKLWFEYDDFDRVTLKLIGPDNTKDHAVYYSTYEYSSDERTLSVKEGDKYETTYILDAFGNIVKEIDGNTNERSYVYNFLNQLTESYDGYGNKTSYLNNALDEIKRVTLPDGTNINYEYNHMGLLVKVTDECGTVYTADYDKTGNMIKEWNRSDSEKSYKYDSTGRIIEVACGGDVVESYSYGSDNRNIIVSDGNGNNYYYNYDAFGRLINEQNRLGLTQNFLYDEAGQLKSKISFDNGATNISYSYDRLQKSIHFPDGSESMFVYDEIGNLLEAENSSGKMYFQYDQGGRMIYQKDGPTGEEIYFSYDNAGNRIGLESSNRKTTYIYGKNNELKELTDNKQKISMQLTYDVNGRENLRTFGNGVKEETIYDKVGRVIVKTHKSARGELLWGEGYVYGENGKRSASVDYQGRVTLYEYNSAGQLAEIYYPYTAYIVEKLKKEAEENGLTVRNVLGENRFLTSTEKSSLIQLLEKMQTGLGYTLPNLQTFIREKYTYDKNGNRKTKTTNFGTIEYIYDSENYLVSSGAPGSPFINYSYDAMGNLISEKSSCNSIEYTYNSQGRLIDCEVINHIEKTYCKTSYKYDALGRRVVIQDENETAIRTLYDGLSFDIIKQSPVMLNGMFTDTGESGIHLTRNGSQNGGRYRYISDENNTDGNRYYSINDNPYKIVRNRYSGERTIVSYNESPVAQFTADGQEYYSTDISGSITCVTDVYGVSKNIYSYDSFGLRFQGDFYNSNDFGYLGKQQDVTSEFYNYGHRDYSPKFSRFTTRDPIRDGYNWYSYCSNDPVNFLDISGLEQIAVNGNNLMQDKAWKNKKLKDTDYEFVTSSCAVMSVSDVFNENPEYVNDNYVHNGCLDWYEVAGSHNQKAERKYSSFTKDVFLNQLDDTEKVYQTLVNVNYDSTNHDHWVGVKDVTTLNGKDYVVINPTSINDKMTTYDVWNYYDNKKGSIYYSDSRLEKGWIVVKGEVLVPVSETKGYVNFIETKKEK